MSALHLVFADSGSSLRSGSDASPVRPLPTSSPRMSVSISPIRRELFSLVQAAPLTRTRQIPILQIPMVPVRQRPGRSPVRKGAGHLQFVINPSECRKDDRAREGRRRHDQLRVSLLRGRLVHCRRMGQLWNSSPNYGTDSGAFGERLGAAPSAASPRGLQQLAVRSALS